MSSDRAFVSSRLPVALRDRLKAFAVSRGQSVEDVVEHAVTRLLDEEAREPPTLAAVLRKLRDAEPALRQQGVSALWVFGSVARGEARLDSDVDLALAFAPHSKPSLFTLAHLQEQIGQGRGAKVDLGLRRDLRPHVLPAFERDAVRAFLTRSLAERRNDIRKAARDAIDISATLGDSAFHALPHADRIARHTLRNALSELGEAVKTLPRELTDRHAHVDWRGFARLRDVVAPGCFRLRQDMLSPIVRDELPRLLQAVEAELSR